MSEYTGFMFALLLPVVLACIATAAWCTAIWMDISNDEAMWALADFLFGPIGVIRGLMYWFGGI